MTFLNLATEEDKEEILALYKAQLGREFCPWDENYPNSETIDYDLSRDSLYVLRVDHRIIATISIEEDEDVDKLECWDKNLMPGGELARLAVLPEEQNHSHAKEMLLFGMKELKRRGFKSIHFLVDKSNTKAIRSYSVFGFNTVGECHMYERDFLCYEMDLNNLRSEYVFRNMIIIG